MEIAVPDVLLGCCNRPCRTGKPCQWPAGGCSIHRKLEALDMAREDRLSYINLGKGLCNALTASGRPCDQLCGRCPYHAEESRRCESCLDAQPKRRCQLARVGETHVCEYHTAFPDLGKMLLEHLRAGGAPAQEEFLAAHYPASAGEFRGSFQALVATLSAQVAAAPAPEACAGT